MNSWPGRLVACVCAGVISLGGVAACTSAKPKKGRTVTVTVPPSTPPSSSSTPTPAATPTPSSTVVRTNLGGTCDTLLPDALVTQALGVTQIAGVDAFVVGLPDKTIGRISTINCRYGVVGAGAAAKAKVEIGISLYGTPAQATARIKATSDDYEAHGATSTPGTLDGATGASLTGGVGAGYDVPLLAVASGQRTVAVSIDPAVTTPAKNAAAEQAVTSLALQRTAG